MFRHLVRQRLDQLVLPPRNEAAQILANRSVIDRAREIVAEIAESSARLQGHRDGQALRLRPLLIGNADARHEFQRFDSDLVVRQILVHGAGHVRPYRKRDHPNILGARQEYP